MKEQEIRDRVPSGATHYQEKTGLFHKWDGFCLYVSLHGMWVFKGYNFNGDLKPL